MNGVVSNNKGLEGVRSKRSGLALAYVNVRPDPLAVNPLSFVSFVVKDLILVFLGGLGALAANFHSGCIPAALITFAHFADSDTWNFASSAEVVVQGSMPVVLKKDCAAGLLVALMKSSRSRATTAGCAFAGV